mmetsp:Transcript_10266/g.33931  ORF Transcript_10266/g.33931 Transcript_10266/m.33931 type:complete len:374 (+) Transcript_10266:611-1732(+)
MARGNWQVCASRRFASARPIIRQRHWAHSTRQSAAMEREHWQPRWSVGTACASGCEATRCLQLWATFLPHRPMLPRRLRCCRHRRLLRAQRPPPPELQIPMERSRRSHRAEALRLRCLARRLAHRLRAASRRNSCGTRRLCRRCGEWCWSSASHARTKTRWPGCVRSSTRTAWSIPSPHCGPMRRGASPVGTSTRTAATPTAGAASTTSCWTSRCSSRAPSPARPWWRRRTKPGPAGQQRPTADGCLRRGRDRRSSRRLRSRHTTRSLCRLIPASSTRRPWRRITWPSACCYAVAPSHHRRSSWMTRRAPARSALNVPSPLSLGRSRPSRKRFSDRVGGWAMWRRCSSAGRARLGLLRVRFCTSSVHDEKLWC